MTRPGNRPGRVIRPEHWRQIATALDTAAKGDSVIAVRDRALLTLAVTSSLRVSECIALDTAQILTDSARLEIRSQSHLRVDQAKGGIGGPFVIPKRARTALRAWLRRRRELTGDERGGPLFVTVKHYNGHQHVRMTKRTAQRAIEVWGKRAGLAGEYSFHDLRHTAVTRFEERCSDPFMVARFARHKDLRHSQRYTHVSDHKVQEAAESL